MDLSPRVTQDFTIGDDQLWLGSKHGTDCPRTVTLDIESGDFNAYIEASAAGVPGYSILRSGLPLARSTVNPNLYTVAAAGAAANNCEGHLLQSVLVATTSPANVGASLLWHGVVDLDEAPIPVGFTADDGAPHVLYV